MFSPEHLNPLIGELMARLGVRVNDNSPSKNSSGSSSQNTDKKLALTPSQGLVIAGILGGVLEVDSILVDKNQIVQIVLSGSLKRKAQKTQVEQMMDQMGGMPFDDVMRAMINRLT